jgi:hypothetical protein
LHFGPSHAVGPLHPLAINCAQIVGHERGLREINLQAINSSIIGIYIDPEILMTTLALSIALHYRQAFGIRIGYYSANPIKIYSIADPIASEIKEAEPELRLHGAEVTFPWARRLEGQQVIKTHGKNLTIGMTILLAERESVTKLNSRFSSVTTVSSFQPGLAGQRGWWTGLVVLVLVRAAGRIP